MIIAVEKRLNNLKEGLEQKGYHVVDLETNQSADAIVYYNNGEDMNRSGAQSSQLSFFSGGSQIQGAFLINAHHKSIDEIDHMLKKRSYSPLFTSLE